MKIKPKQTAELLHNYGCGISYLQRNHKVSYTEVPPDSWFLKERLTDKIAIDIPWSVLEPEEGNFVWDSPEWEGCFQSWIDAGFKVLLKVRGMDTLGTFYNQGTPQWVFDAGAKYVDEPIEEYRSTFLLNDIPENAGKPVRYPVYWDPVYLEKTANLVRALGERYNGRAELECVAIAHMGRWGEMHIAHNGPIEPWLAAGFSLYKYTEAHKKIIDMYLRSFPDTQLSQEISEPAFAEGITMDSAKDIFAYLADNKIIIKQDGLGKSWTPDAKSPYLQKSVADIFEKYYLQTKVAFENLILPEALDEGLSKHISYWQRGGESAGLGILNVEKNIPVKDKRIYSFYNFFPEKYDELAIEGEKDLWRKMALNCGYRLVLEEFEIPDNLTPGESFTTFTRWRNKGAAPCYEKFRVRLSLFNLENHQEIWSESRYPNQLSTPDVWSDKATLGSEMCWTLSETVPEGIYGFRLKLLTQGKVERSINLAIEGRSADGFYNLGKIKVIKNRSK